MSLELAAFEAHTTHADGARVILELNTDFDLIEVQEGHGLRCQWQTRPRRPRPRLAPSSTR